jgi:hypothetical protein
MPNVLLACAFGVRQISAAWRRCNPAANGVVDFRAKRSNFVFSCAASIKRWPPPRAAVTPTSGGLTDHRSWAPTRHSLSLIKARKRGL